MGSMHGFGVRRLRRVVGLALVAARLGAVATVPAQALAPTAVRTADAGSGTAIISGRARRARVRQGAGRRRRSRSPATPTNGDPITRTASPRRRRLHLPRPGRRRLGLHRHRAVPGNDVLLRPRSRSRRVRALTLKLPGVRVRPSRRQGDDVELDRVARRDGRPHRRAAGPRADRTAAPTAYTGKTPVTGAGDGAKAAVVLPTATGAANFQYLGRFEVCCSATEADTWVHTRPINPGGQQRHAALRGAATATR